MLQLIARKSTSSTHRVAHAWHLQRGVVQEARHFPNTAAMNFPLTSLPSTFPMMC